MNDSDGCLKWTIGMIGWWIFCGICLHFDICPMTPILWCVAIIIGVIFAFGIGVTIKEKRDAKKEEKRRFILDAKYERLKKKYPRATAIFFREEKYFSNKNYYKPEFQKYFDLSEDSYVQKEQECKEQEERAIKEAARVAIFNQQLNNIKTLYKHGLAIWKEKNKEKFHPNRKPNDPWIPIWEDEDKRPFLTDSEIVKNEHDIKEYESIYNNAITYSKWQKEQNSFSSLCWNTAHDNFPNLGRYKYPLYLPSYNNNYDAITNECTIWQIFTDCFCADSNIDYTYYKWINDNFEKTKNLDNNYIKRNVNRIVDFIKKIDKEVTVIICPGNGDFFDDTSISFISWLGVKLGDAGLEFQLYGEETPSKKYVVLVEAITSNSLLKEHCQEIISKYSSQSPCLCYISLMKGYDTDEMQALIDKKKIEEKEREKQKIAKAHKKIVEATQKWDTIFMGFQAVSMLDYYPTTSNVNQTSDIWNDRRMVWNFKNNPEKVYDEENEKAVEWVVKQAEEIIVTTFGKENAQYVTFVCIPASSQEMTERRYKAFSEKLCKVTGMINAFNHLKVTRAKAEKHTGGSSFSQDMLEFDKDFFKDKYVLLFDDVITSGSSMKSFKSKLQELGSTVIGGISIGRTKDKFNEHTQRVTLESLGIKSIPKPLFTMGGKPHPHDNDIISDPFGIISTQDNARKELRVGSVSYTHLTLPTT